MGSRDAALPSVQGCSLLLSHGLQEEFSWCQKVLDALQSLVLGLAQFLKYLTRLSLPNNGGQIIELSRVFIQLCL